MNPKSWDKNDLIEVLGPPLHGGPLRESRDGRFSAITWQQRQEFVTASGAPPDAQWLHWDCFSSKVIGNAYLQLLQSLVPALEELAPQALEPLKKAIGSWLDLDPLLGCVAVHVESGADKRGGWVLLKPCVKHTSLVMPPR